MARTKYCLDGEAWYEYRAALHVRKEGEHIIEYYSIDKAGNIERTKSFTFRIDKSPPDVTVIYPNGGEIINGTVNIRWIAVDISDVSISIYYSSDNGTTWHCITQNTDNDGEYVWDTGGVNDGMKYLIKVVAEDEVGHISMDVSDSPFIIYNNYVQIGIVHPRSGYLYINDREILPLPFNTTITIGKITLTADVRCGLPIQKVEFYIDGNLKFSDENLPYEWLWNEMTYGLHTVTMVAYDVLGTTAIDEIKVWTLNL